MPPSVRAMTVSYGVTRLIAAPSWVFTRVGPCRLDACTTPRVPWSISMFCLIAQIACTSEAGSLVGEGMGGITTGLVVDISHLPEFAGRRGDLHVVDQQLAFQLKLI